MSKKPFIVRVPPDCLADIDRLAADAERKSGFRPRRSDIHHEALRLGLRAMRERAGSNVERLIGTAALDDLVDAAQQEVARKVQEANR